MESLQEDEQTDSAAVKSAETGAKCIVLDLFVCLIKDLRQDVYPAFLEKVLPATVAQIDCRNLLLLDHIFSMLSFAMKYLVKNIKHDIERFYGVISELVYHRNRHLRKFVCQALSYVLRKFMTTKEELTRIVKMIGEPEDRAHALGVSDLYFEMAYGAAEDLYTNATDLLEVMAEQDGDEKGVLRLLLVKLFNAVDTSRQLPLYEIICTWIDRPLGHAIIQDALRLKQGRRINLAATITLLDCMKKA